MDLVRLELTPPTLQGWRSPIELQARGSDGRARTCQGPAGSGVTGALRRLGRISGGALVAARSVTLRYSSDGRARTFNLLLNREALCQLSYIGMWYPREDSNLHRPG